MHSYVFGIAQINTKKDNTNVKIVLLILILILISYSFTRRCFT